MNNILKVLSSEIPTVSNNHEKQIRNMQRIGEQLTGFKAVSRDIIPHLIYFIHEGTDLYSIISDICGVLKKYSLIKFEGISDFVDFKITQEMLLNPDDTEETLIEVIINASFMTDCFKGLCVINFTHIDLMISNEFILKLLDFIKNMSKDIKFLIFFRHNDSEKSIARAFLQSNLHFQQVQFNELSQEECIFHANTLLNQSGTPIEYSARNFFHKYICEKQNTHQLKSADDLKCILNKIIYMHYVNNGDSEIKKYMISDYINQLESQQKEIIQPKTSIGFNGGN